LASVAYWYQDKASKLPRSFRKEERVFKPIIGASEIHKWHISWRIDNGKGSQLWGDEKQPSGK
jgi:hypothetical protein